MIFDEKKNDIYQSIKLHGWWTENITENVQDKTQWSTQYSRRNSLVLIFIDLILSDPYSRLKYSKKINRPQWIK